MADPFRGEFVWSRTDDLVIAVTSPGCLAFLRRCLGAFADLTSRRIAQHARPGRYANGWPVLRAIVHERAGRLYGPEVNIVDPDIEREVLCEMTYQYGVLDEELPRRGGVIEIETDGLALALLWLLSDVRDASHVQVNQVLRRRPYAPEDDREVGFWQAVDHDMSCAINAFYDMQDAELLPADAAPQLNPPAPTVDQR